ncbi:MAG: hypothetical protein WD934_03810 [Gemmatimonadales bacterium]
MAVLEHDQPDLSRRLQECERRLQRVEGEVSRTETRMRTLLTQREGDYLMAVMKAGTLVMMLVMVILVVVVIVTGAL